MFDIFKKNKKINIVSPLTGKIIDLTDVPDEVFSSKAVGDGVAIEPTEGKLLSPVKGTIRQIFHTKHAVGIETKEGIELLMHIGINTVELSGKGFEQVAQEGDKVKPGDELVKFDLDYIKENATSIITPILITNMNDIKNLEITDTTKVTAGSDELLTVEVE